MSIHSDIIKTCIGQHCLRGLILFIVCSSTSILTVFSQSDYWSLVNKGSRLAESENLKKDSLAVALYEKAFSTYPDSIEFNSLYEASVLAAKLNLRDQFFEFADKMWSFAFDEDGTPVWSYFYGRYKEQGYSSMANDNRWKSIEQKAKIEMEKFYARLENDKKEFFLSRWNNLCASRSIISTKVETLYDSLKYYSPYLPKKKREYSISFKINDSLSTSYFIHLPSAYDSKKQYPLLIYLHGAVRNSQIIDFQMKRWIEEYPLQKYLIKLADYYNIIIVFPKAGKEYNWMNPDKGFFMVPQIVTDIKSAVNINDSKIFIMGHSNGATGAFSYLMKDPSLFAGFYGMNNYPKVFTGGTFIENIKNRSFMVETDDLDYYYPPEANDSLTTHLKSIRADYKEFGFHGFGHNLPYHKESHQATREFFKDMSVRVRNKYPLQITWEFDDNRYGKIDWLSDIKLDTIRVAQNWHKKPYNFKINKWLKPDKKGNMTVMEVSRNAVDFPRKSGKIIASYQNNCFDIRASRIKSFQINISPEMIDLKKRVKVKVNGKIVFNKMIAYDRNFMLNNFITNHDRSRIWINRIRINI